MSEYINRSSIYNKLRTLFDYWSDNTVSSNISVNMAKNKVLPMIMEEVPINLDKELNTAQRDATNYLIKELRLIIPEALWDKTAEKLAADQCLSLWQYCLECVREMKDAWETENGENLVWVPEHYEEAKMSKEVSTDYYDSFDLMHYGMKLLHDNGREIMTVFPYEDGWCIVYKDSNFWAV